VAGARVVSGRALGKIDVPAALATGALVIEDAAAIADERALFHLINLAREQGAFLLFTARSTPALWPIALREDLRRALRDDGLRKIEIWTARHGVGIADWPAEPIDPFFNVNTPEDAAQAADIAARFPDT